MTYIISIWLLSAVLVAANEITMDPDFDDIEIAIRSLTYPVVIAGGLLAILWAKGKRWGKSLIQVSLDG